MNKPATNIALLKIFCCVLLLSGNAFAQGTWTMVSSPAPDPNGGVMLLLSDGTVIVKTTSGGPDEYGSTWNKLTPDIHGSYIHGTWGTMSDMTNSRLYFSSQVMRDGRVYVAGGEYGTGCAAAEIYDPLSDIWLPAGLLAFGDTIYDQNSTMLPDGRVLQGLDLDHLGAVGRSTLIYDPATNSFTHGPTAANYHYETSWVKLPDNSVLFIDWNLTASERYIPSMNTWIPDANVPVNIYDAVIGETGPAVLLADGRAFVIGGNGKTAFYTPSGNTSPGTWMAGPVMPDIQGMPDASASVMPDGKVLCIASDTPNGINYFPSPMSFFVFDPVGDTFTRIMGPYGLDTMSGPCFSAHTLNLPDGSILFSSYGLTAYYIYTPAGTPLASGKPTIDNIIKLNCDTFMAVGKLFNGLTEGSYYGDDWQMSTNYPLIRLIDSSGKVYYTRTYNWNRTGVRTGTLEDTTFFVLPNGLPEGTYSLEVVVNGIASATRIFKTCHVTGVDGLASEFGSLSVFPNPASGTAVVSFDAAAGGSYVLKVQDVLGRTIIAQPGTAVVGKNQHALSFAGLPKGIYSVVLEAGESTQHVRVVVE